MAGIVSEAEGEVKRAKGFIRGLGAARFWQAPDRNSKRLASHFKSSARWAHLAGIASRPSDAVDAVQRRARSDDALPARARRGEVRPVLPDGPFDALAQLWSLTRRAALLACGHVVTQFLVSQRVRRLL